MDARTRIKKFILDEIVGESVEVDDFGDDESLIDAGILDSLGMLKLIAFLDEEMSTGIMAEEFRLEDFATLEPLCYGREVGSEGFAEARRAMALYALGLFERHPA